jgi:glucose/arabinose dehydrogenase
MRSMTRWTTLSALLLAGCAGEGEAPGAPAEEGAVVAAAGQCDPGNGGLSLPEGFCAMVVSEDAAPGEARLRHLAVEPDGDIYVAVQGARGAETPSERGGILALRDTDGDGRPDEEAAFGPEGGTGLEVRDGYLYFATNSAVLRYRLGEGLEPAAGPDTLVRGLPDQHSHTAKSIALGPDGALFVNIGSPTNACQPLGQDRAAGVMGEDPCPQLDTRAGVWRFAADRPGQTQEEGERWATGIRNAVALAWNPNDGTLYAAQHGRDQLDLWPGFTPEDNSVGPAEELQRLTRGADFGWPYCYYDTRLERRVLAPEYGGDGQEAGRCAEKAAPLVAFPGHWAPNDLLFYAGEQFPERYRGGAFVAFHGSWNRAPVQQGYRVAFVPFQGGQPAGEWETFADGFAGPQPLPSPGEAEHRPVGLAQGPDGALYVTDSQGGTIWKIVYVGGAQPTTAAN